VAAQRGGNARAAERHPRSVLVTESCSSRASLAARGGRGPLSDATVVTVRARSGERGGGHDPADPAAPPVIGSAITNAEMSAGGPVDRAALARQVSERGMTATGRARMPSSTSARAAAPPRSRSSHARLAERQHREHRIVSAATTAARHRTIVGHRDSTVSSVMVVRP